MKPLGTVGSTGQPSPKGAVAIAVEECHLCGQSVLFVKRSQEYIFSVAYPGF